MGFAIRKFFITRNDEIIEDETRFEWFGGFSINQKQKCVESFHRAIKAKYPTSNILEVSSEFG